MNCLNNVSKFRGDTDFKALAIAVKNQKAGDREHENYGDED
jgi:hypothetical protein